MQVKKEKFFKALIVEDEYMQQKIISNYIFQFHYTAEVVETAEKAIQLIHTKIYDLILTDLGLPDQGGDMIVHQTRMSDLNRLTPLIVLTAHANAELQERCLRLGADEVLIKPITLKSLEESILNCSLKESVESNLADQFQIEWMNCKTLLETNPLILPNKEVIADFITRFKIATNKAIHTLEEYQRWVSKEV